LSVPRTEYLRPRFVRREWLCPNGPSVFEADPGDSGLQRGLPERNLSQSPIVFCASRNSRGSKDRLHACRVVPARGAHTRLVCGLPRAPALPGGGLRRRGVVDGTAVARHRGGAPPTSPRRASNDPRC